MKQRDLKQYYVKQAGRISRCGRCPSHGRGERKARLHLGIGVQWDWDKALRCEIPGRGGLRTRVSCQAERTRAGSRARSVMFLAHPELQEEPTVPEGSK